MDEQPTEHHFSKSQKRSIRSSPIQSPLQLTRSPTPKSRRMRTGTEQKFQCQLTQNAQCPMQLWDFDNELHSSQESDCCITGCDSYCHVGQLCLPNQCNPPGHDPAPLPDHDPS